MIKDRSISIQIQSKVGMNEENQRTLNQQSNAADLIEDYRIDHWYELSLKSITQSSNQTYKNARNFSQFNTR